MAPSTENRIPIPKFLVVDDLAKDLGTHAIGSPAILLIGEVARPEARRRRHPSPAIARKA